MAMERFINLPEFWIGLDWIGLDWFGLDWIGLDWFGLDWFGFCYKYIHSNVNVYVYVCM